LLIGYGTRPEEGLRDVQNALAVVQKIDKNFEAFCLRTIAKYHRQIGQRPRPNANCARQRRSRGSAVLTMTWRRLPQNWVTCI
jgi:hypothetical protein